MQQITQRAEKRRVYVRTTISRYRFFLLHKNGTRDSQYLRSIVLRHLPVEEFVRSPRTEGR